jgi:hypothetical protein
LSLQWSNNRYRMHCWAFSRQIHLSCFINFILNTLKPYYNSNKDGIHTFELSLDTWIICSRYSWIVGEYIRLRKYTWVRKVGMILRDGRYVCGSNLILEQAVLPRIASSWTICLLHSCDRWMRVLIYPDWVCKDIATTFSSNLPIAFDTPYILRSTVFLPKKKNTVNIDSYCNITCILVARMRRFEVKKWWSSVICTFYEEL